MAHGPSMGSLVLPHEARRGGMGLPLSLAAHAAFVGALLMAPRAARVEVPEVFRRPMPSLSVPAPETPPIRVAVALPPAAARTTRPAPVRTTADPAPQTPAAVGAIPVPLDVPDTIPVGDEGGACAGCVIGGPGSQPVAPAGGPGTDTGAGTGPVSGPRPIGGRITAPVKLRHVDPGYPALARQAGMQGTVTIECVIDIAGNVVQARVVNGPPLLTAAALDAVRQWKYRPTLLNGEPVSIIMSVSVQFHLR